MYVAAYIVCPWINIGHLPYNQILGSSKRQFLGTMSTPIVLKFLWKAFKYTCMCVYVYAHRHSKMSKGVNTKVLSSIKRKCLTLGRHVNFGGLLLLSKFDKYTAWQMLWHMAHKQNTWVSGHEFIHPSTAGLNKIMR